MYYMNSLKIQLRHSHKMNSSFEHISVKRKEHFNNNQYRTTVKRRTANQE